MVRFIFRLFVTATMAAIVGVGGLATAKRMQTGSWSFPDRDDVAWLRHVIERDRDTPRVIYLHRERLTVKGGFDDARAHRTQLLDHGQRRTIPGFRGSDRTWRRVVACVRKKFADFDVAVTDERPSTTGYVMVHVGGRPRDLFDRKRVGMGGVAPFTGDVMPGAIAFAFSRTLDEHVVSVCNTIAHEAGHLYGLDHAYRCHDLMTYLRGCDHKRFVRADVRCGEHKRRDCDNGARTQNSHQRLFDALGPRQRSPAVAARVATTGRR